MLVLLVVLAASPCPPKTFCNTNGPEAMNALFQAKAGQGHFWVVGELGTVLRGDGRSWQSLPTGSRDSLHSVLPLGPDDVWVSGGTTLLHWDGAWHAVSRGEQQGWAGELLEPTKGEVWVLGSPPLRFEGGTLKPVPSSARELERPGEFSIAAEVCGPNDVWVARRTQSGSLVMANWDGTKTTATPYSARAEVAKIACVGHEAWVSLEDRVLRCRRVGCVRVEAPAVGWVLKGAVGPWLVTDGALWRWDGTKFVKRADAPGHWLAGFARSDDDVVMIGADGATAHFNGRAVFQPPRAKMGYIAALSATPEGEVWSIGEFGVHTWREGAWVANEAFPASRDPHSIWAASRNDVWATAGGKVWHWNGARWAQEPFAGQVRAVWGRGPKDVWFVGDRVWRLQGAAMSTVSPGRKGWFFTKVVGDDRAVWALARGPRPEEADGPSTGAPDAVMAFEDEDAPRWLTTPGRPTDVAVVGGALWVTGEGTHRREGGVWTMVDRNRAHAIVPTARGAILLTRYGSSLEWDGKTLSPLQLPASELGVGTHSGGTVWLGGRNSIVRRLP